MKKTLKYKTTTKNNTRKHRGGIGINIFGKSDYGKTDYGKSRIFKEPKITELPFMYFYDIQSNVIKDNPEKEKESLTTNKNVMKDPESSYSTMMNSIWNDKITFEEKQNQITQLKKTIEKDITITDEQRKNLIDKFNY
jgi:hypothetical protein